jgi:hypothetical protein
MNAELRETIELARTIDRIITYSEHHLPSLPVRNAAERMREGLIDVLRTAIYELAKAWPATDPKEIARFRKSLEHGEVPLADPYALPSRPEIKLLSEELSKLETKLERDKGKAA